MENPPTVDLPERLTIDLAPHPRGTVVTVVGELDHDSAPCLQETLTTALNQHDGTVVIDCAGITFCDSSGLNTLLRARRSALALKRDVVLAAPSHATSRLLRLTGAEAAFGLAPTVEAALGG